jgi:signal transduction histidine kinase
LNRLVEDLLTANKLDAQPMKLAMEKLSSKRLLEGVRQAMVSEAESRGREIEVAGADVEVLADEFQISRVLINLCANALKYTPSGTTVKLMCTVADERVIFSVEDHGPGIPEKLQPHLFERYQQGQDEMSKLGFGLGLYIARSIVEAHGERIWFENKQGDDTGCRFYFTLPRAV